MILMMVLMVVVWWYLTLMLTLCKFLLLYILGSTPFLTDWLPHTSLSGGFWLGSVKERHFWEIEI